jgi:hypothetical protein
LALGQRDPTSSQIGSWAKEALVKSLPAESYGLAVVRTDPEYKNLLLSSQYAADPMLFKEISK